MTSQTSHKKDFTDTRDSFSSHTYAKQQQPKGEEQYQLTMQRQSKAIVHLLEDGMPTKEQIEELLAHFEKETNNMIH
jgi:dTDP-glucose pyrophosphorylase